MTTIHSITAREIIDSRGFPTVEADVILDNGMMGRACVPSGASTGTREALELRDNDPERFIGKGVITAVNNIKERIAPALKGRTIADQTALDNEMITLDGSDNKANLGANAILAVSMAVARARAQAIGVPLYQSICSEKPALLPVPMMNIINGGVHADNNIDLQEFMIIPAGANSFSQAMRYGIEVFHSLKKILNQRGFNTNVGDEGGFAPDLPSNRAAIDIVIEAIEVAGLTPGKDIYLGLDLASSEFFQGGQYHLKSENRDLSSEAFVSFLVELADNYPIISIEDGMSENDWHGWMMLTEQLGKRTQLVGDDLFVTNPQIFEKGIKEGIANSILIKLNQIGTLSEALAAIELAKEANYSTVISHRSGETEDTFIADLAVATGAGQIKTGSVCRTDRVAKYNQLLRIEAELGADAEFLGTKVFSCLT